jgi:acetyl-CoA carboxylase biotin carboxyl carrier protein
LDKEVKDLIDYISKSNFAEFELEKEGLKIKLVKESAKSVAPASQGSGAANVQAEVEVIPSKEENQQMRGETESIMAREPEDQTVEDFFEVKSPIVGTFYTAPNPDADPYVEVGAIVKKGQVLCIVEAMKLMNEIEAEVSGEMVEILVPNAHPVEYGQILFKIRPAE